MRFANIFETTHGQVLVHIVQLGEGRYSLVVAFQAPGREFPSSISVNFQQGTPEMNLLKVREAFTSTTLEIAEELVGNVIADFTGANEPKPVEKPRIHLLQ